jgi:GNAT superfamily N-acetyltransferase
MPWMELKLSPLEFLQLPRNAAYKYDYQSGAAWLNPRPRYYHAVLDLHSMKPEGAADVRLRRVQPEDWDELAEVFAEAFRRQQPFAGLTEPARLAAGRRSLARVREGGDGPWIEQASFVACDPGGPFLGAVFVTLLPLRDPTDWDCYTWESPPPPNAVELRQGRPHLTWIFVRASEVGQGVGTALLQAAGATLAAMGYDELLSTFMLGNDSSMLWHWRVGFRLLSYPGSLRRAGME